MIELMDSTNDICCHFRGLNLSNRYFNYPVTLMPCASVWRRVKDPDVLKSQYLNSVRIDERLEPHGRDAANALDAAATYFNKADNMCLYPTERIYR